jgi:hypothetical protein
VQSTGTRAANTEYGKMLRPRLVRGRRFAPTAVVDGKLTTGQNPQSVRATAALLIAALPGTNPGCPRSLPCRGSACCRGRSLPSSTSKRRES